MKFIHCADVHLDSPLEGLSRYEGAPADQIRNATRKAFQKVVDVAIAEKVDFLLIAGDLYDTGLQSYESVLFFNAQAARLQKVQIPIYLVLGNHDAANKLKKNLNSPSNVHVFSEKAPQTIRIDTLGVAIHGQSFARPDVTNDLAAQYPAAIPGLFNIGLLHTNVGGNSSHGNYAPCSLDTLIHKGYQYWALGHVHGRTVLSLSPYVIYPGNLQGRHAKETGEKGCELVSVGSSGAITINTIPTTVIPWFTVVLDVSGCATTDEIYEKSRTEIQNVARPADGRIAAIRIQVIGPTAAHSELMRNPEQVRNQLVSVATEVGEGSIWVEDVRVLTTPRLNREALLSRDDPIGEVVRMIDALRKEPGAIAKMEAISDLRKKLPAALYSGSDPLRFNDAELAAALAETEGLLLARLAETEPK
jgi:DNA repair exonuclease SbcCD nuclease subunit